MTDLQILCRRLHERGIERTPVEVRSWLYQMGNPRELLRYEGRLSSVIGFLLSDQECFERLVEEIQDPIE